MLQPSTYQQAIYDAVLAGTPQNIFVNAVAGSGKTTTLEGICELLTPDQRSRAVFCAFSKAIQVELAERLPSDMTVKTIHSLSYSALSNCLQPRNRKAWLDDSKYRDRIRLILESREGYKDEDLKSMSSAVIDAVKFCQLTLTDPMNELAFWAMLDHYDIEGPDNLAQIVAEMLQWGIDTAKEKISFTDMIWLPVALNLSLPKWDFVMVDEAQDTSKCMREILRRMMHETSRLVAVGDPRQAIFGFAGAGIDAVERIIEEFNCTELPLSVCYRCPVSHLNMARELVSHIEASETAKAGTIQYAAPSELFRMLDAQRGDLVICRTNAPLVDLAFGLLAAGVPVTLKGRDLLTQLTNLARKMTKQRGFRWANMLEHLALHLAHQIQKLSARKGTEMVIQSITDQCEALAIIMTKAQDYYKRDMESIQELERFMDRIYGDEKGRVVLSSVHKAKGLEAEHIVLYGPENLPHRMAKSDWSVAQEYNLKYVALTRSKDILTFVPLPEKK